MDTVRRFDLPRKMIAAMTTLSWETVPHVCLTYEADASALLRLLEKLNAESAPEDRITLNTALLKVVVEGLKACLKMNGHIRFRRNLVMGKATTAEHIDISMPVLFDSGKMMTVNLRNMENKSLTQIRDAVADTMRRVRNSNMNEAMYEVSIHDTLDALKHLHLRQALGRLIGFSLDGGPSALLKGAERRDYYRLPDTQRLTRQDLEQGTITVSNIGSLCKGQNVGFALLEIVPPQLCAIGIGAVQKKAVVDDDGAVRAGTVLPLTIAFDHRALDVGDITPFLGKLDQIFAHPEELL